MKSPLAGKTVKLKSNFIPERFAGMNFDVIDWFEEWKEHPTNVYCMLYLMRILFTDTPIDNQVLIGFVSGLTCLIHISEIEEISDNQAAEKCQDNCINTVETVQNTPKESRYSK